MESRKEGLGPRAAMTIYHTTFAETSTLPPPNYQILISERWKKEDGVDFHQFLVLAVCDQPFPVEIIQSSKVYKKKRSEAAKAGPNAPLPMALGSVHTCTNLNRNFTICISHTILPPHWAFVHWASSFWRWCNPSPVFHPGTHSPTSENEGLDGAAERNMILESKSPSDCGRQGCCHAEDYMQLQ